MKFALKSENFSYVLKKSPNVVNGNFGCSGFCCLLLKIYLVNKSAKKRKIDKIENCMILGGIIKQYVVISASKITLNAVKCPRVQW